MQPADPGMGSAIQVGSQGHRVGERECVLSIASDHGHRFETLWEHPENAELRERRGSPHVLLPGDRVTIPEIRRREEVRPTGDTHRFRRGGGPVDFELAVREDGEPLTGLPFVLTIERRTLSGHVPADGVIRTKMLPSDDKGSLRLGEGKDERVYELAFGHLDPAHAHRGAEDRLRNLGILHGECDDTAFGVALTEFQRRHELPKTGELDDATARRLTELHGS